MVGVADGRAAAAARAPRPDPPSDRSDPTASGRRIGMEYYRYRHGRTGRHRFAGVALAAMGLLFVGVGIVSAIGVITGDFLVFLWTSGFFAAMGLLGVHYGLKGALAARRLGTNRYGVTIEGDEVRSFEFDPWGDRDFTFLRSAVVRGREHPPAGPPVPPPRTAGRDAPPAADVATQPGRPGAAVRPARHRPASPGRAAPAGRHPTARDGVGRAIDLQFESEMLQDAGWWWDVTSRTVDPAALTRCRERFAERHTGREPVRADWRWLLAPEDRDTA